MRKEMLAAVLLLMLAFAGCLQQEKGARGVAVDFSIVSINADNSTPAHLSSSIPLEISTMSSSADADYRVVLKINGRQAAQYISSGNEAKRIEVPAYYNGKVNISAHISPLNSSKYIDNNATNNFAHISLNINPYEISSLNQSNSTNINDMRAYATKVHFDNSLQIYTIGALIMRTTSISEFNSTIHYSLHADNNNTPSKDSIIGMDTSIGKIKYDWRFILLQSSPKEVKPGDYWIVFSVDGKGYAALGCSENATNSENLMGMRHSKGIKWSAANCTPYILISSNDALSSYKQFTSIH